MGQWMAAVLAAGWRAALSHFSAAALWGFWTAGGEGPIEVSVPEPRCPRRSGLTIHRRRPDALADVRWKHGIPLTSPARTLMDIAPRLSRGDLERAISEADKLELITPHALRDAAAADPRWPGAGIVRATLDRLTFALTDSELERLFLPLARKAGLPRPRTGARVSGFKVDFHWPELGLVVETDGLRYHRNQLQQARDRRRDQAHTAAGLTQLRFTHAQVRFEPAEVVSTLAAVARRLQAAGLR